MKKTLIAVAALAATSAFAQVTISGSMQAGLVNSGADGAATAVTHLGNGANAINLAASEDLGGGLKAGWDGQIRFNAANGDRNSSGQGAALFHSSNVYLSSATLGTARIGKIAEISNGAYDPWALGGGASMGSGIGVSMTVGAAAQANSVSYSTPTFMGFSAGVQKSMSPNSNPAASAGGNRINERSIANLSYANGPITAQILVTSGNANTVADTTAFGAAATAVADVQQSQRSLAASYDFKVAKVNVVNVTTKNAADVKTVDVTSVSGTVPLSPTLTLLAGYNKSKTGTGFTATSANDTKVAVGLNYALSKRTTLGADLFKAEGQAAVAPATGTSGAGYVLRVRHTF